MAPPSERPVPQLSVQLLNFGEHPVTSWQSLLDTARVCDEVGIDRIVVSDHVLLGERLEAYADPRTGGTAGGKQPTSPEGHWLEPLTLLSILAGRTERVRLGTAVLLAAIRPAALLAKQLATLDVLSGGRLDIGVGVGWQREEYEANGLSFEGRGELLDECLEVCRRLWTETVVDGRIGRGAFDRVHSQPKPVQPGGIPLWISGRATARTVRRVVAFGDGWIPWGDDVAAPHAGIAMLRDALAAAGRDPAQLQVQGALPLVRHDGRIDIAASMAGVGDLVAAGVTDFRAYGRWTPDDTDTLAALVTAFRDTVDRRPD